MATQGDGQRIRRGAAHWRALLSRHAASGLGVLAFCRREAVSAASFYRWRARLGGGDGGATSAARAAPAFVEVGALGSAAAGGSALELQLELGAGLVLYLVRR